MADGPVVFINDGLALLQEDGRNAFGVGGGTLAFALFAADEEVTPASAWADFLEATFSGYTKKDVVTGGQYVNGDGLYQFDVQAVTFEHDGGGVSNSIYGWMLGTRDASNFTDIWCGQNFDPPRDMSTIGDIIPIALSLFIDQVAP